MKMKKSKRGKSVDSEDSYEFASDSEPETGDEARNRFMMKKTMGVLIKVIGTEITKVSVMAMKWLQVMLFGLSLREYGIMPSYATW